jgi:NAD(P)-dependent dehydrogenase (short-subunit alcohol dehydrogenase family)
MFAKTKKGTVLVTGGTHRIGKTIAETLRKAGWRVLTSSHREDSGADFICDFADPSASVKLYAAALAAAPEDFCAIVNNAALFTGDPAVLEAVNLTAPRKLTMLLAGREGVKCSVVNILDSKTLGPATPSDSAYVKPKRDLFSDTRRYAALFAQTLRVNAVAPGPVLPPEGVHEPAGEMLLDRRPAPEDIAAAVLYLLEAECVTGSVIPVDAGQHLLMDE